MIQPFRQPNFALLWVGQLISGIGDWVLWIALPFYVYEQTGSALATGAMFIATTLPPLVFGSLAGVFVDRWHHQRTMIAADLLRALVILLLLLTRSAGYFWLLYPLAFAHAFIAQFFAPAKSAILPRLVSKASLLTANILISISGDIAMLVGPAISGLLYAKVGLTGVVLIDVASFLLSALLIGFIQLPVAPAASHPHEAEGTQPYGWTALWQEWQAGLNVVRQHSTLATLFIVAGVDNIGNGIVLATWAIHVRTVLGGGANEYGWIQVAVAAGGIFAGVGMATVNKLFAPQQLIAPSGILTSFLLFTTFNVYSLPLIFGLQFFAGIAAVGFYVPLETLLQSNTPQDFLGRVFGAFNTTNALLVLVGQGLASPFADRLGSTLLLNIAALTIFLSGLYALISLRGATRSLPSRNA